MTDDNKKAADDSTGLETYHSGFEEPLTRYEIRDRAAIKQSLTVANPLWVDDEEKKAEVTRSNTEARPRRDRARRKETGKRGQQTQAHKDAVQAAKRRTRLGRPNKHGTTHPAQSKRTPQIVRGSVELSEELDETTGQGGLFYTWTDDQGNLCRRKMRSDAGKQRGRNKLTQPGVMRCRKTTAQGILANEGEIDTLEAQHQAKLIKQEVRDDCRAGYFRFYDETDEGQTIPRSVYYRWRAFFGATRWRPDFDLRCPICRVKQPHGSRRHWVERGVERRVVCKKCHVKLRRHGGEVARPPRERGLFPYDQLVMIETVREMVAASQAQLTTRPHLARRIEKDKADDD